MPKIQRTQLPNGCSVSPLAVIPKDWKSATKIKGPWRITYRFYDPSTDKPKQVSIKTMNQCKTVKERKEAVRFVLERTMQRLKAGYNPIHKRIITIKSDAQLIETHTPFIVALREALTRVEIEEVTRGDIDYIIDAIEVAAKYLNFDFMEIKDVRRRHIKMILDYLSQTRKRFTNNTYNHYRANIRILFEELMECEATEVNPIDGLKKRDHVPTPREVLTDEQDQYIDGYLEKVDYNFYRYRKIFRYSGARSTELLRLQVKYVDLQHQRYTTLIKKGKKKRWVQRTIKDIALPFWKEVMAMAKTGDDYLFSVDLVPGEKTITPNLITRRWYKKVKKEVVKQKPNAKGKKSIKYVDRIHLINGKPTVITADFYSHKHKEATNIVETELHRLLEQARKAAAEQMGHTSTAMVAKIYNINDHKLRHEIDKKAK